MQAIIIGIVISGLFVFLFGAISHARPDDRLRGWVGGWLSFNFFFALRLWQLPAGPGQLLLTWFRSDLLILGGVFFIASNVVLTRGRRSTLRLGLAIALSAFALVGLARLGPRFALVLAAAVLLRQFTAVVFALRDRRVAFGPAVALLAIGVAVGSLCAIWSGQQEWVVTALESETYLTAAIGFWYSGAKRTVALRTTVFGLIAFAGVFPIGFAIERYLPQVHIDNGLWNLPGLCAGVGMVLLLVEEQLCQARAMGHEYRLLFDNNPHPMWVLDAEAHRFIDVNLAAAELHGYTREEFLELELADIVAPERRTQVLSEVARGGNDVRFSIHRRKDGTLFPMDVNPYEIDFRGRRCRFVLALDATERESLERLIQHQSEHDPLTGLANRMLFQEHLSAAVREARDSGDKLAILCLDICRFKRINDVFGPRVGDECIRHVASVLSSRIRASDFVGRIAGDEFAMVLTGIRNAATVEQRASDLRALLEEPVVVQGYPIQLTFSVGLAICPDDGEDPLTLWSGAEGVLRRSQESGGGLTAWLSHESQDDAQEQVAIEACLRMRMEEAGFHLVYQPLYDFSGRVRCLEALLRLNHPAYGAVSPAKVIPIAEETGLIVPLGLWVFEEVCRQLRTWIDEDDMRAVPIAINVSALQLMHVDFADRLMEMVRRYGINPKLIHLELTESAAMRNLKEVSAQMARLAGLGFSFLMDDFGTGHSSLGRLHQLPLSVLKIDRSFIEQLCAPSGMYTTLNIVQAIVSMGHALHQKVVAEGVETEAQLACLSALDCDLVQGFHLSRPIPPADVPALVNQKHPAFKRVASAVCSMPVLTASVESVPAH